jgi:hypothetical protein
MFFDGFGSKAGSFYLFVDEHKVSDSSEGKSLKATDIHLA